MVTRELPIERATGAAPDVVGVGVHQVEVDPPERLERAHGGGVLHLVRLHHLAAGAAGSLAAVRRTLVAVELEQRE